MILFTCSGARRNDIAQVVFFSPYNVILFVLEGNMAYARFLFPYNVVVGNVLVLVLELNPKRTRFFLPYKVVIFLCLH